jgi:Domain of unknown function (DUF6089)
MKNYLFRLIILGLCLYAQTTSAQMRGWELGGWIGGSNYFGDLNTTWRVNQTKLSGGVGARYNFNDRLCLKFGFNAGEVAAYDADSKNVYERRRNLHFKSLLVDATAQFEFNFMPYVHGSRDFYYTPYMFLGPSFYYFNPRAELDGTWYKLVEYGTEGQFRGEEYNLTQGALAYGFGFKVDLSYRWSINIELGGRKLFTDYFDDVSGIYADPRDIRAQRGTIAADLADRSEEPKIGLPGRQRGNGKSNDMYAFLHVGMLYYFGQIRCPGLTKH